jgi:predicted small lipoprotein YifL
VYTAYCLLRTAYGLLLTAYHDFPMRAPLLLIAFTVLLAGCGYKGPLYLPKPKPEAQAPAPSPAPQEDDKKPSSPK